MLKTQRKFMSANDAKQRWGSLMGAVERDGERVIVESHGKPKVAVISVDDLERLEALDERELREEAVRQLRALQKRIGDRNANLTEEEIDNLSLRAGRDINQATAEKQQALVEHQSQK